MIRWLRLLEAAKEISHRQVDFYLTSRPTGYRGALLSDQGGRLVIYLDLLTHKSEKEVIETTAHELAHFITGDSEHDAEWQRQFENLKSELRSKFDRSSKKEN